LAFRHADIWQTAIISIVCTAGLLAWRKDLLVNAFDPQHARAIGLPVGWLHYGLLAVLSLTIVGALKAAGIILGHRLFDRPRRDGVSGDAAVFGQCWQWR
jgi:manganese/iron transport system permease protein